MSDSESIPEIKTKKSKRGGKREKIVLDELMTRQIASLLVANTPMGEIASKLDLPYNTTRKIANSKAVRGMLKEVGEAALTEAKNQIRKGVADLVPLALEALKKNLEEDSIEAVKVVFKTAGALEKDMEKDAGITAIQVVLPGSESSKTVEVENENF